VSKATSVTDNEPVKNTTCRLAISQRQQAAADESSNDLPCTADLREPKVNFAGQA
jgi:hypothetical protein